MRPAVFRAAREAVLKIKVDVAPLRGRGGTTDWRARPPSVHFASWLGSSLVVRRPSIEPEASRSERAGRRWRRPPARRPARGHQVGTSSSGRTDERWRRPSARGANRGYRAQHQQLEGGQLCWLKRLLLTGSLRAFPVSFPKCPKRLFCRRELPCPALRTVRSD